MPMLSFGGAVSAMIASLKNNARKRKTLYDDKQHIHSSDGQTFAQYKKASPEFLKEIKDRLQAERRERVKRQFMAAGLALMIGFGVLATLYIYRFQLIDAQFVELLS